MKYVWKRGVKCAIRSIMDSIECRFVCLFVIILHSAAGGHGISRSYFLPASSVT